MHSTCCSPGKNTLPTVSVQRNVYIPFQGARVWVPDREKVWVGGELVRVVEGESVEVQCEGEEGKRLLEARSHDQLPLLRNPEMLVGANDLTTLSYLHEPAGELLRNLYV